jgi:ABC-type multidrug transport system fused ATPase/permease subunit
MDDSSMDEDEHTETLISLEGIDSPKSSKQLGASKSKRGRGNKTREMLLMDSDTIESVDNESDKTDGEEKKTRTLFEPLKEGSKDKDWGKPSLAMVRRLLSLGRAEIWKILGATIALIVGSLANLALPKLIGNVMDAMGKASEPGTDPIKAHAAGMLMLKLLMIRLAVIFALIGVASWIRQTLFGMAGEKIVANLRRMLFDKLLTMEIAFYDVNRTGELVNRLSSDTQLIQSTVTTNVSQLLRNLALVIGGLVILFSISWKLTMLMFVILPILAGIAFGYGSFVKKLSKQVQDVLASATAVAEETLSSMRTVKSFGSESKEGAKYAEKVRASYAIAKKRAIVDGAFESAVGLVINICLGSILFFGGWLVIKGDMTPGTLTSFVLYVIQAAAGFVAISALFADFMRAMGASERVFELLDRVPTVRFEGGERPHKFVGKVEFKNVNFSYPARIDHPVLKDLSIKLSPGKTLALVGPSGGGKSTIAHLLLGLYTPITGSITIDDVNTIDLEPSFLRHNIAVVSQEPTLFASSILDNICYGVGDVDDALETKPERGIYTSLQTHTYDQYFFSPQERRQRVEEAAKKANAHEFIMAFPEGYDTMVGERGIRLSGGQKQRIAIARALLKNPKILILDEATSALDSESEHLVKEALDELLAQGNSERAYLVIAHRLSTVKNAEEVAVVMDGHIVERGSHEQLVELDGVYKKLVSRQLSQD